jgi:lipoyl(octanoyl) transferase
MDTTLHFDVIELGRRRYAPVLQLQEDMVAERKAGARRDLLILVEHEPVFTLGRNAQAGNVLVSRAELARRGVDVADIGRGGDVTYHGPGQLVGYPIIDLRALGEGVLWYVDALERVIQATLADFSIPSGTDREHRGVWVGQDKIAALGVRITRGVTMHGFALNVQVDMAPYAWIIPCGIRDRGVTSMHTLRPDVSMADVKARVIRHFDDVVYGGGREI